jgi:LytS/YehU family sensor histidine kinase
VIANLLTAPFGLVFWRPDDATLWDVLLHPMMNQVLTSLISFWVVAAAAMLTASFEERRQRESALARMRAQLTDAKLQSLRYQLNPHFLFNSINAAVSFVRTGHKDQAERMLLALSELMDAYLSPQTPLTMALQEELTLLHQYLEIESIRFGAKLRYEEVLAPGSETIAVPSMLLQPLLENAVRHGISQRTEPGLIRLQTHLEEGTLTVTIDNDVNEQARPDAPAHDGHGLGLSLTRARLAEAYAERAGLEAGPRPDDGYRVCLWLPALAEGV